MLEKSGKFVASEKVATMDRTIIPSAIIMYSRLRLIRNTFNSALHLIRTNSLCLSTKPVIAMQNRFNSLIHLCKYCGAVIILFKH